MLESLTDNQSEDFSFFNQNCTLSKLKRASDVERRQANSTSASPVQVTCENCCPADLCNTGSSCFQANISPTVETGLVYGSINFRCSFDLSVSDSSITWYKDGQRLDPRQHPRVTVKDTELTMLTIDRLDSGQYSCRVHYDKNSYSSSEASLVIAGGPEIKPSSWVVPTIGRTVELTCDVTGATTDHNFVWLREGGSILDHHFVSSRIDTPISTKLAFRFSGVDQSGIYVCRDIGSLEFQPYEKIGEAPMVFLEGSNHNDVLSSSCVSSGHHDV
ncbi:basement membrane-specific heparan sulfate proteoglycan core protein [Plakobranchus ocellatus]|uniref:Basement membrane-specific heparan sulfate proteoglycan core protein n=1 Tax=Plakobranchus ocellatus TaxID=259542 RepID=A0AAV4CS39_9GAST|nr:basement membrane-specific heparan sulfate proteoglycan core protein [Plakobranchus ocellatus]